MEKLIEKLKSNDVPMAQKHLLLRALEMKHASYNDLKDSKIVKVVKMCRRLPGKTGTLAETIINKWKLLVKNELNMNNNKNTLSKTIDHVKENIKNEKEEEEDTTARLYPNMNIYCTSRKPIKRKFSEDENESNSDTSEEVKFHGIPLIKVQHFDANKLNEFELKFNIKSIETEDLWINLVNKNYPTDINKREINESWKDLFYRCEKEKENKLAIIAKRINTKVEKDNKINKCRIKLIEIPSQYKKGVNKKFFIPKEKLSTRKFTKKSDEVNEVNKWRMKLIEMTPQNNKNENIKRRKLN